MTAQNDITDELRQLAEFAVRNDLLYQAELRLAGEFSLVAQSFAQANPRAADICENFIKPMSPLVIDARTNMLEAIKSIRSSLDKLQGHKPKHWLNSDQTDYFAQPDPAQFFLRAELAKRELAIRSE